MVIHTDGRYLAAERLSSSSYMWNVLDPRVKVMPEVEPIFALRTDGTLDCPAAPNISFQ